MPAVNIKNVGAYRMLICGACGRQYYTQQEGIDLEAWFRRVHPDCSSPVVPARQKPGVLRATAPTSGPGTELKALLKDWLGIVASPNCSCNARARQMDEWGPDLCEQNLPTIVDWLGEQAAARKLPFVRFAAEQAVKLAIRRARKKAAR
jgi:hypothetical protein